MIIKLKHSTVYITTDRLLLKPDSNLSEDDIYKKNFKAVFYPNHNIQLIDLGIITLGNINQLVEAFIIDNDEYSIGDLYIDLSFDKTSKNFIIKAIQDDNTIYQLEDEILKYNNESTVVDSFQSGIHVDSPRDLQLIVGTF